MAKIPTMDEWAEKIGNRVLNEYVYEGRTLKEWIDLMASRKLVILPEKPSNGDVIEALFPHYDIEVDEQKNYVRVFYDSFYTTYPLGWWLKPYKAESSETKRGLAYADQETMMPAT